MTMRTCPRCGGRKGCGGVLCRACRYPPLTPGQRARLADGLAQLRTLDPDELIRRIADGLSEEGG